MEKTLQSRLEEKYIKTPSGHWIWTAYLMPSGYGMLDKRYAHRISYELYVGPIPEGLVIDHLCRVKKCVNPMHLQPVRQRENFMRGSGPMAVVRSNKLRGEARTHCPHGHELTEENTVRETKKNGNIMRRCRSCRTAERARRR